MQNNPLFDESPTYWK